MTKKLADTRALRTIKVFLIVLCFIPNLGFAQDLIEIQGDRISVSTHIDSSVERVWAELLDFKNYPSWNSWYHVEGRAHAGAKVNVVSGSST